MRKGSGIAGATLLYTARQGPPDLLAVMQCLVQDLRADNRRIVGLRHTAGTLRLRADPWDMVLTLADQPLPLAAMGGLLRPARPDGAPDFASVHLGRALRQHAHALGFLLRRRGALPPDVELAARALAREGQLSLIAVFHAAPPALLIWQPGGLVLTPDELRSADPALLLTPREAAVPLGVARPERLALARPEAVRPPRATPAGDSAEPQAADDPAPDPAPDDRAAPRLFGDGAGPSLAPVPGLERASDRVTLALRGAGGVPRRAAPRARRLPRAAPLAVALMWAALLPDLVLRLLPGL